MSLYNLFKTDEDLEKEGIWIQYGEASNGQQIGFKIARAGGQNTAFAKALEKATKPYRKAIQTGMLDDKTADSIYKQVFIDTVVLDWKNVENSDGEILKFNKENAIKLFSDLPELFADLREQAGNVSLFRAEVRNKDLGNSGRSLNTASSKGRSKGK